jgi:hypothetical protein
MILSAATTLASIDRMHRENNRRKPKKLDAEVSKEAIPGEFDPRIRQDRVIGGAASRTASAETPSASCSKG